MVLRVRSPRSSCQGWLGVGTLFLACKLAVFSRGPSSVSMERERGGKEGRGQPTERQTDKKEVERVARAGEEQEKNDTATNIAY